MAPPTKFSDEIKGRILVAIEHGAYMETAAAHAGIAKDTLYRWLKQGARDRDDGRNTQLSEFSMSVDQALAKAELIDLQTISKFAAGFEVVTQKIETVVDKQGNVLHTRRQTEERKMRRDWQAAAWKLERRYPSKYGRRVAFTDGEGKAVAPALVMLPDDGRDGLFDDGDNGDDPGKAVTRGDGRGRRPRA